MNTPSQLAVVGPIGSLAAYRRAVSQHPMLSLEEERELAERWHQDQDLNAAWKLVTSHLRCVVSIARGYNGYGLPQDDLIQEGNVGLMKAVKRFDPSFGVRLVSFATHWIRASIYDYILRNWRIVKIVTTKAQRKLFFNLRGMKKHLSRLSCDEAKVIAEDLNVPLKTVFDMEQHMSVNDIPFNADSKSSSATDDSALANLAPEEYLPDLRYDPVAQVESEDFEKQTQAKINQALAALDERSRDIIQRRWLGETKDTLQALANDYGVSAERIRQIEHGAMKCLRTTISG